MLKKNQIDVLNLFRKNIFLKCNILQITEKLKKKSYQRIYDTVKELEKNKILKIEKIGNVNLVSLLLTPQSISNLAFLDEQEALEKKIPNYERIISIKEISQHLLIVTGSYAKGSQRKSSDLDIAIVIPNSEKSIKIQKFVENITLLFYPPVHLYVFTRNDFIEMLLDKKESYGKEIFRNHIILKNAYAFYEIIKESIEHGFKG